MKKAQKAFEEAPTQYFQGIIQLRNPNEAIIDFLRRELAANRHKHIFVGQEKKVKNGIDLYVSSNKFAINVGRKMYNAFGGVLKINEKIHTLDRQSGKDLYRVSVLFRPLDCVKGDVIVVGKKIIRVTDIGRKLTGVNLLSGKHEVISYKNEELIPLEIFKTTVSTVYPEVQVIHPETYQNVTLKNPKKLAPGEKVKIVMHEGVWVVG